MLVLTGRQIYAKFMSLRLKLFSKPKHWMQETFITAYISSIPRIEIELIILTYKSHFYEYKVFYNLYFFIIAYLRIDNIMI